MTSGPTDPQALHYDVLRPAELKLNLQAVRLERHEASEARIIASHGQLVANLAAERARVVRLRAEVEAANQQNEALQRRINGAKRINDTYAAASAAADAQILRLQQALGRVKALCDRMLAARDLPVMNPPGEYARGAVEAYETVAAALGVVAERPQAEPSLTEMLTRQREWSIETFGPGQRTKGVIEHIRKELIEVEENPADATEWIDVVILALDGAWRNSGLEPAEIVAVLLAKYERNRNRRWPDWRTASEDVAIEHIPAAAAVPVQPTEPHAPGCNIWKRLYENGPAALLHVCTCETGAAVQPSTDKPKP